MIARLNVPMLAVLAPPFVLGIAATTTTVGLDPILRTLLHAVAFTAAIGAAWFAASRAPTVVATASSETGQPAVIIADRRRPTFDRESGLCANWYFRLRIDEEIVRADRFGHVFTLLKVTANAPSVTDAVRRSIKKALRSIDLASDMGDSLSILLPNTPKANAALVIERLEQMAPGVTITAAAYPADGATFAQLFGESEWLTSAAA